MVNNLKAILKRRDIYDQLYIKKKCIETIKVKLDIESYEIKGFIQTVLI